MIKPQISLIDADFLNLLFIVFKHCQDKCDFRVKLEVIREGSVG